MDKVIIRNAIATDLEKLLEFEQGIINSERPFDLTLKAEQIHYYDLAQMISAPDTLVLVAVINSKLMASGYARIESAKSYLKHKTYAYMGFMYTDPNYRGKGINSRIINSLMEWCQSRNIVEVRLDVYNDNISAIKAYEKIGFKKHLITMRIAL